MNIKPKDLSFRSSLTPRSITKKIVVHHTAGPLSQTVEEIHNFHRSRGWVGVGYNLVQEADGSWYEGRGLGKVGAHAASYNDSTIGICLVGNFELVELSKSRWDSLVEMCVYLCKRYSLQAEDVVGHGDLPGARTACPGKFLDIDILHIKVGEGLSTGSGPLYRVVVDGEQVGAYRKPLKAIEDALRDLPAKISVEKIPEADV